MKFILALASALAFSTAAHAAEIEVHVTPEAPVVIQTDLQVPDSDPTDNWDDSYTITGPWFAVSPGLTNTLEETITVHAISFSITMPNGEALEDMLEFGNIEIAGGDLFNLEDVILSELPETADGIYNVKMEFHGWVGGADSRKADLEAQTEFVTQ